MQTTECKAVMPQRRVRHTSCPQRAGCPCGTAAHNYQPCVKCHDRTLWEDREEVCLRAGDHVSSMASRKDRSENNFWRS